MSGRLDYSKELRYPNLSKTGYEITSEATAVYNCFAWAAEEDDRWWDPSDPDEYYWPEGVPRELTLEAAIQAYSTLGYECCESSELELGFQKLALYATSDGEIQHAARQLPDGTWTSKLGEWEDIKHQLEGLENPKYYGLVKQILQRRSTLNAED